MQLESHSGNTLGMCINQDALRAFVYLYIPKSEPARRKRTEGLRLI